MGKSLTKYIDDLFNPVKGSKTKRKGSKKKKGSQRKGSKNKKSSKRRSNKKSLNRLPARYSYYM